MQSDLAVERDASEPDAFFDARDFAAIAAVLLLTLVVFANGLRGEFVHDDKKQIVQNELIRDPHRWRAALSRDIWAFKGERSDQPWSNYWRPGHVTWLIANVQLFGAEDPLGWHVANLLAHAGVAAAAYALVRRLGATRGVAMAIVCLFAVHPTHVESVTWIAGGHDVLCALWQLIALLLLTSAWNHREPLRRWPLILAAVAFYALAVSTKEVAIFFPLIVALARATHPDLADAPAKQRTLAAARAAAAFVVIAGIFLVARRLVLGRTQISYAFAPSYTSVIKTLPAVLTFYLRQMVFPYKLGWTYPLRIVTKASVDWRSWWFPLLLLTALVALLVRVRWDRLRLIGLAIFVLTLLPALNLRAFQPDNLVKDRFLYTPLLGFLMILVPTLATALRRTLSALSAHAVVVGGSVATASAVALLAFQTVRYNTAWLNEVALWSWAVKTDPTSAMNHHQLAVALDEAMQFAPARAQIDQAIALAPTALSYLALADIDLHEHRYEDATAAAQMALKLAPDDYRGYERLAITYQKRGQLANAESTLRDAARKVPYRSAYFTDQLAVILYQQGRRDEALRELESVLPAAEAEVVPQARLVFFHLGMLYQEQQRTADARQMLEKFLRFTEGSGEPTIVKTREQVQQILGRSKM